MTEITEEADVMGVLLEVYPAPMSVDDLCRELGDKLAPLDALARLKRRGLVHELRGFVWASRAATTTTR